MIKKKLDLRIGDLKELIDDLDKKIESIDLFVYRGIECINEELFSIVGSVKSYTIQDDGTAEFVIKPLMKGYEGPIEEADALMLSIDETKGVNVKGLILLKDGKYI